MLRIAKLKRRGVILVAAKHNKREIIRELVRGDRINASRSDQNYCLAGPACAEQVAARAEALMSTAGIIKLRSDAVLGIEIIFSIDPGWRIDSKCYFTDATQWCEGRFGKDNILSADVHADEGALHCHVLILPLRNGRMNGSAMVGGKAKLADHSRDFELSVMNRYGLQIPRKANLSRGLQTIISACTKIQAWERRSFGVKETPAIIAAALKLEALVCELGI
jgi:hypothetical protein